LVVACGDKTAVNTAPSASASIEGTYIPENGKGSFTFSKDGEVTYNHPQYGTKVTNYKKQNTEISFQFKEGYLMKMTVLDNGQLKSMVGDTYVKQ
jgi:hypothetical protein